jgi:hypothetical protein
VTLGVTTLKEEDMRGMLIWVFGVTFFFMLVF